MVGGADDPFLLHPLDDRGGAVVADAEAPLDVAGRGLLVAQHHLHGLVVEVAAGLAEGALVEHRAVEFQLHRAGLALGTLLGRALLVDDGEHLLVGVSVVDHQGLVEPLGEVDVAPERRDLRRAPLLAGAEVVEPGLPHRANAVVGLRQRLDLGQRILEGPLLVEAGRLVGVQRDAGDQGVVRRRRRHRPAGAGQVAPDLDDPGHPDRGGRGERLRDGSCPVGTLVRDVEVAVVVDDVPMGISPDAARKHIKLLMLVNDVSLRNLIPGELGKGFGFYQAKPSSAFSPVAVTPDSLADAWDGAKLHLPLRAILNGTLVGQPNAGIDMTFDFGQLIAHAAKTRPLCAGTIIGSGTVSNLDRSNGSCCLAEVRMLEIIANGSPSTEFMRFGDRIQIDMLGINGQSLFGEINQQVTQYVG